MKFRHAEWRKLYREEQGAFAQLPWLARAAAAELLKPCDDAGRIHVGELRTGETAADALVRAVAFRMGATRGDRRSMAILFPLLFTEGYLVHRGAFVCIRTFVAAQARRDSDEERSDHESATTVPQSSNEPTTNGERPSNDSAATEQRSGNEAATKPELTPRKHDADDASARARARSSVLSSSVPEVLAPQSPPRQTGGPTDPTIAPDAPKDVQRFIADTMRITRERSAGNVDERVAGEKERGLVAIAKRFGVKRLGADLADICDCAADPEGLMFLRERYKGPLALSAMLGKPGERGDYAADGLFACARIAREWLETHAPAGDEAADG